MFGYVSADPARLSQEDIIIYRGAYCGLCNSLGKRHGLHTRLTLNYDMTFLSLILSSVYGVDFEEKKLRCPAHPASRKLSLSNEIIDYAADMNVALSYMNCLDDWEDDRKVSRLALAKSLKKEYTKVYAKYPRQCEAIEKRLTELSAIEKSGEPNPDKAANTFAKLLSELFIWQEDGLSQRLREFGMSLGRAVYFMDAAVDIKKDLKRQSYNPLVFVNDCDIQGVLDSVMARVTDAYEALETPKYKSIFDNIIYSGIWTRYEIYKRREAKKNG